MKITLSRPPVPFCDPYHSCPLLRSVRPGGGFPFRHYPTGIYLNDGTKREETSSEERPLAIGFSDLRGFTSYTAERGDREAYRLANAFIEMAEE